MGIDLRFKREFYTVQACQLAVFFGILPPVEQEIDDKLLSNFS
jgi:hypothetical protein